jgi:hypothetical protein
MRPLAALKVHDLADRETGGDELGDLRFRALMSEADWLALPLSIRRRFRLPGWASPGALSVTHAELGDGRFLFQLDLVHPRLGRLIQQTAAFQEAQP